MAKRRKKKSSKNKIIDIDFAVISMMIASVLLGFLIYTNSGYIGETIGPILSGIFGKLKFVLPVGFFAISIYLACDSKDYLFPKLIQYALLLLFISTVMCIYQVSIKNLNLDSDYTELINSAYELGEIGKGGGAIGAILAIPLAKLLGSVGAVILSIGISILMIISMFKINVTKIISSFVDEQLEKGLERKENKIKNNLKEQKIRKREEYEQVQTERNVKNRNKQMKNQKQSSIDIPLDDQIEFDNNFTEDLEDFDNNIEESIEERLEFKKNRNKKKREKIEEEQSPDYIDSNLFKKQEEQKEEKVKEVLLLEHTLTVEDEHYEFPPIQLLTPPEKQVKGGKKSIAENATKLQKTLYSFGVSAKVENVSIGPAITRYELKPAEGVRVNKIANLADDIALNLAAASIRIEAPIPGKQAVGIEVPNVENEIVHLREVIECEEFKNHKSKLAFALGKDVAGNCTVTDISKMPHMLIAGSTGSGKSVCINTIITSIIYKAKPSEVKLVMVDPKVVELSVYNGIPHLLIPVVTDPKKAAGALAWAVQEMVNRYKLFANKNVRDIKGYNEALGDEGEKEKLPQIVIIIDELADLMMVAAKDVEDAICRLAQMARAAGMHLVIATQRPSVDVITGIIKANIPSRIAFAVSSQVDSRTILDMVGAEKLLGKGDMLFYPSGAPKPVRVQGAYVSDKDVEKIVDFLKSNAGEAKYSEEVLSKINVPAKIEQTEEGKDENDADEAMLNDVLKEVVNKGTASALLIQRKFKVGYARAARLIDMLEERGYISEYAGSKPRKVLITKEQLAEMEMGGEIKMDKPKDTKETINTE